ASGSRDGYANVWSVAEGLLVRSVLLPNQERVLSVALSSDGAFLATGGDEGNTYGWRVTAGVRLWGGGLDNQLVYSACVSPDNSLLAVGRSDGLGVGY